MHLRHGSHHHHGHRFAFDKVDKLDDEERSQRQPPEPLIQRLELQRGVRVLDLGAGTGYFGLPILRRLRELGGGTLVAADIEPRMLDRLSARAIETGLSTMLDPVRIEEDAPHTLPLAEGGIDLALMVDLYHELDDRAAILGELRRVLRRDGTLWIVDWDPDGSVDFGPPREHRIPPDLAFREVLEAGFSSVERLPLYLHHFTLGARRP